MGPNGWQTFEGGEIALGANQLNAMEVCPDGRALFFTDRLYAFDGLEWHDYGRGDFYSVVDIDCSQGDEIWVAGYNGAAQYVGTGWMEFPLEQILGTQDPQEYPRALVADAQGGVWVALSNTLAHYDGSEWTLYREGQGLNKKYYFIELGLDSRLRPWALHSSGLVDLDGGIWRTLNFPISITAYDMALDPLDRVWVGTNNGLRVYENGQWRSFDVRRGDKSAEAVNLVAVDGQARVWIGTPWGVNVMDGTQWTTYYMHTSELPDNDVDMLMVLGDGPPLAAPLEKEPGQISGRVLENGVAVPGTTVEVCVEYLGMFFSGATPCADQPFKATTTTDDKGFFTLPDLPTGHYYVAVRSPNGEWKVLSTTTILGDVELPSLGGTDVLVSPGQTTTLQDIELADSD
jgi:ligand-binding sensor domain-containing protein